MDAAAPPTPSHGPRPVFYASSMAPRLAHLDTKVDPPRDPTRTRNQFLFLASVGVVGVAARLMGAQWWMVAPAALFGGLILSIVLLELVERFLPPPKAAPGPGGPLPEHLATLAQALDARLSPEAAPQSAGPWVLEGHGPGRKDRWRMSVSLAQQDPAAALADLVLLPTPGPPAILPADPPPPVPIFGLRHRSGTHPSAPIAVCSRALVVLRLKAQKGDKAPTLDDASWDLQTDTLAPAMAPDAMRIADRLAPFPVVLAVEKGGLEVRSVLTDAWTAASILQVLQQLAKVRKAAR